MPDAHPYLHDKLSDIHSKLLGRDTVVDIFLPAQTEKKEKYYPLLILNDGQDSESIHLKETLEKLTQSKDIKDIMVVGVHAGDRMQEYGVTDKPDFHGRGARAKSYAKFIMTELIPYLEYRYSISKDMNDHAIAGYSLGGLSALDIAWQNPHFFGKVGAFSGSFWWRKRDTKSRFYSDNRDRIMHHLIRTSKVRAGLKFWFQVGTQDERSDRNKNGVIDSIDDTLDLIAELTKKGYRPFHDIQYLEVKDGKHNTETWAEAMPHFLKWAFPA